MPYAEMVAGLGVAESHPVFVGRIQPCPEKQAGAGGHFVAEVPRREALDMETRHAELAFLTMDELAAFCDVIPARAAVLLRHAAGPWIFYKMRPILAPWALYAPDRGA